MGRNAAGVIGLKFKKAGDELVACDIARDGATLLHITEQGFGKRTSVDEYPTKGRGGMGVVGIKIVDEKARSWARLWSTTMMKFSRSPAKAS